jgi:hypothetical protein
LREGSASDLPSCSHHLEIGACTAEVVSWYVDEVCFKIVRGFDIYTHARETGETSHGSHPDTQAAFVADLVHADLCPDMGLRDPTDTLRCPCQ